MSKQTQFNVVVVGQKGRLGYEAILFAASFRKFNPDFAGRLLVAEPQPNGCWSFDPRMSETQKQALSVLDVEIVPFENEHFGESYPNGNKIECLKALPEGENFVFFDTDTIILDDLAKAKLPFSKPAASMKRENTWPTIELYGPGYAQIWKSLYDRFGLDFEKSLDLSQPDEHWERYQYFNAGWFYYKCPKEFGNLFTKFAVEIRDNPPEELVCQVMYPWLDQVALPLVITALGGGRPNKTVAKLDGDLSCHYRFIPLLYARESDETIALLEEIVQPNKLKKVLKEYDPIKRMILQKRGHKVRALFDQNNLPRKEQAIRNRIKSNNFWMR